MGGSESFLGVRGYAPHHVESVAALSAEERARLREPLGRELVASWAVWDTEDDAWFVDGPVVLEFAGAAALEIAAFKTYLCLSWASIDVSLPIVYSALELEWHRDALEPLNALRGRTLTGLALLESRGELNGVAIRAGEVYAELFNALDELGLRSAP